jgi:hypothetical protein
MFGRSIAMSACVAEQLFLVPCGMAHSTSTPRVHAGKLCVWLGLAEAGGYVRQRVVEGYFQCTSLSLLARNVNMAMVG